MRDHGEVPMTAVRYDFTGEHFEWLVERRSQNQRTSLKLYRAMERLRAKQLASNDLVLEAAALVAVSFSLWRAVFLCTDTPPSDSEIFESAQKFIMTVISDNAISYPQDKSARQWTALYYLNNAHSRLLGISEDNPEILPGVEIEDSDDSRIYFDRLQTALDVAVVNFARLITREVASL